MRKILLVFMMVTFAFFFVIKNSKECNAYYQNLINETKIKCRNGVFYYDEPIQLERGKPYAVVMTSQFLADAIGDGFDFEDAKWNVTALDENDEITSVIFRFSLNQYTGMHYAEATPTKNCSMVINDLGPKGLTSLTELRKDEIILFQGHYIDFKGFIKYESLGDYNYINEDINLYTDYDNPIEVETITNSIKGRDNVDGIITPTLESDEYTDNLTVGVHEVKYLLKDSENNQSELVVNVHVVDKTPPIISGPTKLEWRMELDAPTIEDIKDEFVIVDNADGIIDPSVLTYGETDLDEYDKGHEKNYVITVIACDSSGNESSYTFVLSAVDKTPPVLEVEDATVRMSELGSYLENILFSILIKEVSDNSGRYYIGYLATPDAGGGKNGRFLVSITVYDFSKNKITKDAYLTIIDDISPDFYVLGSILETTVDNPFSYDDIVSMIKCDLDDRGLLYDDVYIVKSNYFENSESIGTYNINYIYTYDDSINYETATISVLNKNENDIFKFSYLSLIPIGLGILVILIAKRKKKIIK